MAEENLKPFLKFLVKEGRFVLVRPRLKRKALTPEPEDAPSDDAPQAEHERKNENGNCNVNGSRRESKEHSETYVKIVTDIADRLESGSILNNVSGSAANVQCLVEDNELTSATTLAKTTSTASETTSACISGTASVTTSGTTSETTSGTTSATISARTLGTTSTTTSGTTSATTSRTTSAAILARTPGATSTTTSGTTSATTSGTTSAAILARTPGAPSTTTSGTTSATTSGTASAAILARTPGTTTTTSGTTSATISASTTETTSAAISARKSGGTLLTASGTISRKKTVFKRRTLLHKKPSAVPCPRTKGDNTAPLQVLSSHGQDLRTQREEGAGVAQASEEGWMDCSGKCPSSPADLYSKTLESGQSGQERKSAITCSKLHRTGKVSQTHQIKLPEETGSNICDSILFRMQDMLSNMTHPKSLLNEQGEVFSEPSSNLTIYPKSPASVNIKKNIDHSKEKSSSCSIPKTNTLTERDPEVSSSPHRSANSVHDAQLSTANSTGGYQVKGRAQSFPGSHDAMCFKFRNRLANDRHSVTGLAMSRHQQDNQVVQSKVPRSGMPDRRHTLHDIDTSLHDSKNKENVLKFDSRQLHEPAEERVAEPDRHLPDRIPEVKASRSSSGRILKFRHDSASKKKKRQSAMKLFLQVLLTATEQILPELKEAQEVTQEAFCSLARLGEVPMPDFISDQMNSDDRQAASSLHGLPTIPPMSSCSVGNKDNKFLDKTVASKQQKQQSSDEESDEPPGIDPVDSCFQIGTSSVGDSQSQKFFSRKSNCGILKAKADILEDGLHFHDRTSSTENSCVEDKRESTDDEQDSLHSPAGCDFSNADSSDLPVLCDSELDSEYLVSTGCVVNDRQPISPYEHDLLCQEAAQNLDVACSARDKNEYQSSNDLRSDAHSSNPSVCSPSSQFVYDHERYNSWPLSLPNRETQSEGIPTLANDQLAVYMENENYPSPVSVDVYSNSNNDQQRDASAPCSQASSQSPEESQFHPCMQNCTPGQNSEHFQMECADNEFVKMGAVKQNFTMLPSSEVDVHVSQDSMCLEADDKEIDPVLTEDEEEHLRQYFDDESHDAVSQINEESEEHTPNASNLIIKTEPMETAEDMIDTGGACRMSLNFNKSIKLEPCSSEIHYGGKDLATRNHMSTIRPCGVSEPESRHLSTDGTTKVKKERTSTSSVDMLPSDSHHEHCDTRVRSPSLTTEEEFHIRQLFGGDSAASIVDGQSVTVNEVCHQSIIGIGLDSQVHIKRQFDDEGRNLVLSTENVQPRDDSSRMVGVVIKCEDVSPSGNNQMLTGGQESKQSMTEKTGDSDENVTSEDIDEGYGHLESVEDNPNVMSTVMSDTGQQEMIQSPNASSNEIADDSSSADVESSTSDSDFDLPSYLFPDENTKGQKRFVKRRCKKAADTVADETRDPTPLTSVSKLRSEVEEDVDTAEQDKEVQDQLLNPHVNKHTKDLSQVTTDPVESGKDGLHDGVVLEPQSSSCVRVQQDTDDRASVQEEPGDREVTVLVHNSSSKEAKSPDTAVSSDGKHNDDPQIDTLQKGKAVKTGHQKTFKDARSSDNPSRRKCKDKKESEKCKVTVSQQHKKTSGEKNDKEIRKMSKSEDKHHRTHNGHMHKLKQHQGIQEGKNRKHKSSSLSMANMESTPSVDHSILNSCPASVSETSTMPEQGGPIVDSAPNKIDVPSSNVDRIVEADLCEQSYNGAQEETQDSASEVCDPVSDDSDTLPTISLTPRNTPKRNNHKTLECYRNVSLDKTGMSSNRNSSTSSEQESDKSNTVNSTVADSNSKAHIVNSQPSTVPFQCDVCSRVCESRTALNHHRIIHGAKNYHCSVCEKTFYSQSNLNQHLVTHTGRKSKCPVCGKMLASSGNMQYHMRMHSGEKPYKCNVCGMCFSVRSSLRSHSMQHSNMSIECGVCHKTFRDPKLLKRHMRVHGERRFDCTVCGKAFVRRAHFNSHMKIHTGQKDCKCYVCDARFSEMPQLKQHMLIHTGQKDFQCDVCQNRFSTRQLLGSHLKMHAGQKRYKCYVCGKCFSHAGTVKIHMNVHTGARPFPCETCGKAFTQSSHLRTHQHVHKEWTVECNQCDRKFLNQKRLEEHIRTHQSARPFKCDICLKQMLTRKGLIRHKQEYCRKALKPFQCNQCDTRFVNMHTLKSHQKRHSQEGEFPCNICHKIFTLLSKLTKHQLKVHKFSICSLCDASFPSSSDLDHHLGEHQTDGGYMCPRCPTVLPVLAEMEEHLYTHRRKTVQCPTCERHYPSKKHLLEHTNRMHPLAETNSGEDCAAADSPQKEATQSGSDVQIFNCNNCNKTFHDEHHLMNHVLKHKHSPHNKTQSSSTDHKTQTSSTDHKTQISSTHHSKVTSSNSHHRSPHSKTQSTHHNKTSSSRTHHKKTSSSSDDSPHSKTQRSSTDHNKTSSSSTHDHSREAHSSSTHRKKTSSSHHSPHSKKLSSSTHHSKTHSSSTHHNKTSSSSTHDHSPHNKTSSSSTHHNKKPSSSTSEHSPHIKTHSSHSKTHSPHSKKLSSSTHHSKTHTSSTHHDKTSSSRTHENSPHRTKSKHTEKTNHSEHCNSSSKHDHGESKHHSRKHGSNSKHHGSKHHSKQDDKYDGDVNMESSIEKTTQHGNEKETVLHESSRKDDGTSSHKKKKYKCETCDKCFYSPGYLDHHVKIHHGKDVGDSISCDRESEASRPGADQRKEFQCSVCSSLFYSPGHLKHHMKKHTVQALECTQCQRKFSDQYHLDKHQSKHHSEEKEKTTFECEVCLKVYKSKAALVEHMFIHTGQIPFHCDKCEKSFTSKSCFRKHQSLHLGIKPHKCEICQKAFPTKILLENHVRVHTGEKPFPCPVCGKRFAEKSVVTKHMKVHTGEKPFTCDVCDRAFSELGALRQHMMIHSESRPFTCDVCCKSFRLKLQLEVHTRIHIGDYSFKCDECGKAFVSRPKLHLHEKSHTAERVHECETCHKKFKSVASLQGHLMTHNNVKTFECEKCGKKFNNSGNLSTHMKTHSDSRPYSCDQCDYRTRDSIGLRRHQQIHTERSKTHTCDICEKSFFSPQHLQSHKKVHSDERPFKCEICDASFRDKGQLSIHSRTHSQLKPYKCEICHKRFTQSSNKKTHMRSHTGARPHKCMVCDMSFACKQSLTRHTTTHTGQQLPRKECPICHKVLLLSAMTGHMKIHSNIRPFKCTLCSSSFNRRDSLKSHMVTHTKARAWKCDECGKSFTQRSTLVTHKRFHRGERPYRCSYCDKTFTQSSHVRTHERRVHKKERTHKCDVCGKMYQCTAQLRDHARTHTGEKPFKCDHCDSAFNRLSSLKSHLLIHTGVKRFKCNFCARAFAHSSALVTHRRTHTGEKPYVCATCGNGFPRRDQLTLHVRTHTGKEPYCCATCNKTFRCSGNLKKHERTHVGGTFQCNICDESFSQEKYLNDHVKDHPENTEL